MHVRVCEPRTIADKMARNEYAYAKTAKAATRFFPKQIVKFLLLETFNRGLSDFKLSILNYYANITLKNQQEGCFLCGENLLKNHE